MSDHIDRLEPRVSSEQKEAVSVLQNECCNPKAIAEVNQGIVMGGFKSGDAAMAALPQLNIGGNAEAEIAGNHHWMPVPYGPGGYGEYHRPESSGQFQTNTGSANFESVGRGHIHDPLLPFQWETKGSDRSWEHAVASGQFQINTGSSDFESVGRHHHGGYYPYPYGGQEFHRPVSRGQFQTNTGYADFRKK